MGKNRLSSNTYVFVYDNGILLQTINFHTSCSQPLILGDQFGSAQLTEYVGQISLGLATKGKGKGK